MAPGDGPVEPVGHGCRSHSRTTTARRRLPAPRCAPSRSPTTSRCSRRECGPVSCSSTSSSTVVPSALSGTSGTSRDRRWVTGFEHGFGPIDPRGVRGHCSSDNLPFARCQRPLFDLFAPGDFVLKVATTNPFAPAQPIVAAGGLDAGPADLALEKGRPCLIPVPVDPTTGIPCESQNLRQHLVAISMRRKPRALGSRERDRPGVQALVQVERQFVGGLSCRSTFRQRGENDRRKIWVPRRLRRRHSPALDAPRCCRGCFRNLRTMLTRHAHLFCSQSLRQIHQTLGDADRTETLYPASAALGPEAPLAESFDTQISRRGEHLGRGQATSCVR